MVLFAKQMNESDENFSLNFVRQIIILIFLIIQTALKQLCTFPPLPSFVLLSPIEMHPIHASCINF